MTADRSRRSARLPAEQAHLFGRDVNPNGSRQWLRTLTDQEAAEMLQRFAVRCLQQAFEEALPIYWIRRAEQLETVGTPWADQTAIACRRHASILSTTGLPPHIAAEISEFMEVA